MAQRTHRGSQTSFRRVLGSLLSRAAVAGAAAIVAGTTLLLLAPGSPLAAQSIAGAGDDAIPVPYRGFRLRIAGQWNDWEKVYADSAGKTVKRPLLQRVGQRSLGVAALSQLGPAEEAIRSLTGLPDFTISLGTLEAQGDVRQSTAPISIEFGVTRRLSVGLLVPYVESRDNTQLILNRNGTGVTVGVNPAFGRTTGATARASNAALLREIGRARARLTAEIARCADAAATSCEAIRANPTGAQQLLLRALQTQGAIVTIYGDSLHGGSPVVPFTETLLGERIVGQIFTLRTSFEQFGVREISESSRPAGASLAYGPGGLEALVQDSAFGLGYERLGNTRRSGIGDVDLSASFLLFDSFDRPGAPRVAKSSRAIRSIATLGWRFGTAGADRAEDAFDVPGGAGANALLARSTTDILLTRSLWMSASVRFVKPFGDRIVVPVPLRTDTSIFSSFALASAQRSLGSRVEFEVAPRYAFGDFFGVSAAYLFRRVGESVVDAESGAVVPSANPVFLYGSNPATTFQAASAGVTFSTLASYTRGRSKYPVEVLYTHSAPLSGSGGNVPAVSIDRLELRVYFGMPRAGNRPR